MAKADVVVAVDLRVVGQHACHVDVVDVEDEAPVAAHGGEQLRQAVCAEQVAEALDEGVGVGVVVPRRHVPLVRRLSMSLGDLHLAGQTGAELALGDGRREAWHIDYHVVVDAEEVGAAVAVPCRPVQLGDRLQGDVEVVLGEGELEQVAVGGRLSFDFRLCGSIWRNANDEDDLKKKKERLDL